MARIELKTLCTSFALALALLHQGVAAEQYDTSATINFHGTSTLHGFDGVVPAESFKTMLEEDAATGNLRISTSVAIDVPRMSTHHGKRDSNMFKMLDKDSFPLIAGTLAAELPPRQTNGEARLKLRIRDVEQDIAATVSEWTSDNGEISCKLTFPVSLAAFQLKAPSVIGLIRVGDMVDVECLVHGKIAAPEGN